MIFWIGRSNARPILDWAEQRPPIWIGIEQRTIWTRASHQQSKGLAKKLGRPKGIKDSKPWTLVQRKFVFITCRRLCIHFRLRGMKGPSATDLILYQSSERSLWSRSHSLSDFFGNPETTPTLPSQDDSYVACPSYPNGRVRRPVRRLGLLDTGQPIRAVSHPNQGGEVGPRLRLRVAINRYTLKAARYLSAPAKIFGKRARPLN